MALQASVSVPLSGITALLGPSGSGKTSLVRAITGLPSLLSGSVSLDGFALHKNTEKRPISLMFQDARLLPHKTLEQQLAFAEKLGGDQPKGAVEALGLTACLAKKPNQLSGGERKRAALLMAMTARHSMLLLDEPFDGLDVARRTAMMTLIQTHAAHKPVILVSHDYDAVAQLADRAIIILDQQAQGPFDTATAFLKMEAGVESDRSSLLHGTVTSAGLLNDITVDGQSLSLPGTMASGPVTLRLLARDIALATSRPEGTSIQNILKASIIEISPIHGSPFVDVTTRLLNSDQQLVSRITAKSAEALALAPNQSIYLLVKSASFERSAD